MKSLLIIAAVTAALLTVSACGSQKAQTSDTTGCDDDRAIVACRADD